ncbi:flagellar biosynthetic protein FliO [Sinorhizobium sp. 7-81]|uniref:flagellar biosynthetic protein FliO n=1 Tax=Sinorhizobium sp. 8-89 TaxID=3049089 RepID=UPI0024C3FD4A|nr:flagellar biosynthetic protein FliO [Sinorhizobium sp. 8-89]MDK1489536.1 flagellar biosynthetic protein FliO [Sinorhizobium sp. 8-89]
MMETFVGDNGSRFIIAAAAVAAGLLCLAAVLWIMRQRPSSPFVRGGKNRQPRLAVLDAAAVDARRRLVLVRRDDVEHLIMIGGPTDIVIESRIAPELSPAQASAGAAAEQKATDVPKATPRPEPRPVSAPTPMPVEAAATVPERQVARADDADEQPQAAPRAEPAPPIRLAAEQRPATAGQPLQQQPPARVSPPVPASPAVSAIERAEDIFDVARERVLPAAPRREPTPVQRGATQTASAPVTQTQVMPVQPAAPDRVSDFERILDAEISGDLQRLAPSVGLQAGSRPTAGGRQEPLLGTPDNIRKEPTIEEEMHRMLADISAGRKP